MGKAATKKKSSDGSVTACVKAIADPQKRADVKAIMKMMAAASGKRAKMWGPSIIGYGQYQYKYADGRDGKLCRIGLSPRAQAISLYIIPGFKGMSRLLAKLGQHKTAKTCLYIKHLADVDKAVLQEIFEKSLDIMEKKYPQNLS